LTRFQQDPLETVLRIVVHWYIREESIQLNAQIRTQISGMLLRGRVGENLVYQQPHVVYIFDPTGAQLLE
jgi:hypothetical protein